VAVVHGGIGLCDEVAAGFTSDPTMNSAPNLGPCHYLHDGRAASLLEAVLWHGGEALAVKNKVLALSGAVATRSSRSLSPSRKRQNAQGVRR
jgi:hypothetical protein